MLTEIGNTKAQTILTEGKHILDAKRSTSHLERFSNYQLISPLTLWQALGSEHAIVAQTTDKAVTRYRPWVALADLALTQDRATARINWEKSIRQARGQSLQLTVVGWQQGNQQLWAINQQVEIVMPSWQLRTTLLITEVCFQYHPQQGWRTQLTLAPPSAYEGQPDQQPLTLLEQVLS